VTNSTKAATLGRLCLSRISYHCDLQQDGGPVIPLGAIAEVTVGPLRGLGLIARTQLLADELENIGRLLRARITSPFEYLREEFDWAWTNVPAGGALVILASRNTDSMFFSPTKTRGFSVELEQAETRLHTILNAEFRSLLEDSFKKAIAKKVAPQRGAIVRQDRLAA
jgi:hypothetical protein